MFLKIILISFFICHFVDIYFEPDKIVRKNQKKTQPLIASISSSSGSNIYEQLSGQQAIFLPPEILSENAHIKTFAQYEEMYQKSIQNNSIFWLEQALSLE